MKKYLLAALFVCIFAPVIFARDYIDYSNYIFDPNTYDNYVYDAADFALEALEYVEGTGVGTDWLSGDLFNNQDVAIGRPTVDTTGDDWYFPETEPAPVNPVYPPFRSFEIVTIGAGGHLTLKFGHKVRDDENNPYGTDFIVFGNAFQVMPNSGAWLNGNPETETVLGEGYYEPATVSVSQDGVTWYSFTNDPNFMKDNTNFVRLSADANDGPFADSFAPTLGRIYDPNNPAASLGDWNQWWGVPTNPTLPVEPSLWFNSFAGYTVADICSVYGHSAGGTGFDIGRLDLPTDPVTGKKWFQYVRIDDKPAGGTPEIDAVSDVSCCGDWKHPRPAGDITNDCKVNYHDLVMLGHFWRLSGFDPNAPAAKADIHKDGRINIDDLSAMADNWLGCSWGCE